MRYTYETYGTCVKHISLDINGNVVTNIEFDGGCPGNLLALSKLLNGWTVEEIEEKLLGNKCGKKSTSCADQLAIAVRRAYEDTQR
jgi:uncharacterized protein (TIGR03905 family)